jgi:alcohol dehydrogenase (NADP+)
MIDCVGFGADRWRKKLEAHSFQREEPRADDLVLDVLYCGVCHSDVHQVHNDWSNTVWPCVPGHEIVGQVLFAGKQVKKFKVGDFVAVGCMQDSCGDCASCKEGNEQYCESEVGFLGTYNGPIQPSGQNTYGGYSDKVVVNEKFALKIPSGLDLHAVAPILCAGVTTYSPLKHWKAGPGKKVAIAGFGGLGHMGTQIAAAMGAEVTVLTTSPEKKKDALRLGAKHVIVMNDKKALTKAEASFDLIINTIPYPHKIEPYTKLIARDGHLVIVGVLMPEPKWQPMNLIMQRRHIAGSLIGSVKETQEVLNFCARHKIQPEVEMTTIDKINDVYDEIVKKRAHYRYVVDMASIKAYEPGKLSSLDPVGNHLHSRRKTWLAKLAS